MKISKLSKFAWAFFALALGNTTVFSQGFGNQNNRFLNQEKPCITQISDLSADQKNKILELENAHQKTIAQLRNERRSTVDFNEKEEIRDKMLLRIEEHQTEVKNLLTENQQKEYDLLHFRDNNYRKNSQWAQQGKKFNSGKGQNRGNRFARGNGNGCNGKQNGYRKGNKQQFNQGCPGRNQRGQRNGNRTSNS